MSGLSTLVLAFDAVLLALGGGLARFAYRVARRSESPGLRVVAIGVAAVTVGTVLPGLAALVVGADPVASLLAGSVAVMLGFAALAYSPYAEQPCGDASA